MIVNRRSPGKYRPATILVAQPAIRQVKIFGNDYDVLEKLAEKIKAILEKTPGVAEVEFETEGRTPQLQMTVKRGVLRKWGERKSSPSTTPAI